MTANLPAIELQLTQAVNAEVAYQNAYYAANQNYQSKNKADVAIGALPGSAKISTIVYTGADQKGFAIQIDYTLTGNSWIRRIDCTSNLLNLNWYRNVPQ